MATASSTTAAELFGPSTGNGFAELALYDEDGNGWIDEGDSVYARLKIWSKDEEGNDRLISVSDAGVGAIMLGNIDTPFTITNSSNEDAGLCASKQHLPPRKRLRRHRAAD
ncbi:MAG: hypothetical protein ACOX0F_02005 [Syntrophomonadaceae bacterium]